MNPKHRLHQPLAFNVIVAVVIAVCFGAHPGVAQESVLGRWDKVTNPLPFFPVHAHTLRSGKVMIWPGDEGISGNDPRSWDPANQSVSTFTAPGYDLFCSGHSFLADGTLFVAGGHFMQNGIGVASASIYNPNTNTWTPRPPAVGSVPDMNAGRWYPTATVLANGDVLVISGSKDSSFGNNTLPQVFQVGSRTWRNLTSAELGIDLYPQMLLAPNGKVFNPGPTQNTRYLDTAGSGAWSFVANRLGPHRSYGSAVMYAPGKVLVMGGGDPPVNTAEVIDLNQSPLTWRAVGSMAVARRQLNATLLPDGTVLVTGGTSKAGFNTPDDPTSPVHAAELWNPTTQNWTTLASTSTPTIPGIPRIYHSTAVLLPDARVLSMGGNVLPPPYPDTRIAEIYSPPYLFKGARPTITSAPTSVTYGQSFFVGTPDAAAISKVTMLRLSSVTHALNMSQYISTLSSSPTTGGLNVVAPSGAAVAPPFAPAVAPPGPYMLFILNTNGVPSVAWMIQVGRDPTASTLTSLSPNSAVAGGPTFTLTVNGSNFVSNSVVQWNGENRTTTFVSPTQLTASINAGDIAVGGSASVTVRNSSGAMSNALIFVVTTISREVWTGISGTSVANIPVGSAPNLTDTLPSFEAPTNWADNYGTRLRGYIRAPVSGSYIFWIASDDNSELWLSTDDNPARKQRIASVADYTDPLQWDKFSTQKSAAIPLTAGERRYVEALQKEGGGGDNLAVGWAKPGESTSAPSEVIPGSVLSPFTGTAGPALSSIAVTPPGPSILTGATQQFTATGTYSDNSTQNITSQVFWASSSTTVATINASGLATGVSAGSTTISATLSGVTRSTTLTVQGSSAPLAISREVWTGISGTSIANIPLGAAPNLTDTMPSFEAPTNWADNYGTRMRGYIRAPVSGSYTFWIAGDDNNELWLSTDDNPANKQKIAFVAEWTDSRQWNKLSTQQSAAIPFIAGHRYYVEALQKEGDGGDNLAVGWAKPGESTSAPSEVIPGSVLSPFTGTAGPALSSIAVTPPSPSILTGATQQFTATGTYSDNSTQNITSQVIWASSSTTVATINASGLATGMAAGSTTISATSSVGAPPPTATTTLSVQVASAPAPLTITTSSLPDATVNGNYSATLAASGGAQPYTWSVSSGSLPPGLSLSSTGVISGTPLSTASTAAPYRFTARVTDKATSPSTATKALTIKVQKR